MKVFRLLLVMLFFVAGVVAVAPDAQAVVHAPACWHDAQRGYLDPSVFSGLAPLGTPTFNVQLNTGHGCAQSNDGKDQWNYQSDGNLVLRNNGTAVWTSQTANKQGTRLIFRLEPGSSGAVVMNTTAGKTVWWTGNFTACANNKTPGSAPTEWNAGSR